jgi:hypothetical protein
LAALSDELEVEAKLKVNGAKTTRARIAKRKAASGPGSWYLRQSPLPMTRESASGSGARAGTAGEGREWREPERAPSARSADDSEPESEDDEPDSDAPEDDAVEDEIDDE